MTAIQLVADLKAAGLTVQELDGWKTRGNTWARSKPEGVIQHHTAPPVPYPPARLISNNQIKANMNTKPDGTVWMIAYHACNYSSGPGSSVVLTDNVRPGVPPRANAKQRGLTDNMGGNRHFWNFENDHAGDGGHLPMAQFKAIVVATVVVNAHFGLTYQNTISHAEWTRRKIDPRWNGDNRTAIEQLRTGIKEGEGMATGPNGEPNWDEVSSWAKNSWAWAWDEKILSDASHPKDIIDKEQLMVHLKRASGGLAVVPTPEVTE